MTLDLDHEASLDPARSGAKAAWLARARQGGLPVLPGLVVDAASSRHHIDLGAATLRTRGSGGARLAVIAEPVPDTDELLEKASILGERLVARSSTTLEAFGEWSGAFTSYVDIGLGELPKAVAGCWSSVFSVSALERQAASGIEPGSFPMAVLVQRSLDPTAGGTARLENDGSVVIDGIKGSPAPLLQGWSAGHRAVVPAGAATARGDDLIELIGSGPAREIATLIRRAHDAIGADRCEWALDDRVWLLQLGVGRRPSPSAIADSDVDPAMIGIVQAAARAPGTLGEELILPWAIAGLPPAPPEAIPPLTRPEAMALRDRLVREVWEMPALQAMAHAREHMTGLLGPEPGPWLKRLATKSPAEASSAHRLLAHLDASLRPGHDLRLGLGRWEPLIAAVTLSLGTRTPGTPASPGIGAGARAHIDRGGAVDLYRRRSVVTCPRPVPNLAPMLWDSAGLVTETGSPAAHLFESARALTVPAVCGVALPAGEMIVAVDGDHGIVATIPLNGEDNE